MKQQKDLAEMFDATKVYSEKLMMDNYDPKSQLVSWPYLYHMRRVTTMRKYGFGCDPSWIILVSKKEVRKPCQNKINYFLGKWKA